MQRFVKAHVVAMESSDKNAVAVIYHLPGIGWCKKHVQTDCIDSWNDDDHEEVDDDGTSVSELPEVDPGYPFSQPSPKLVVCNFANLGWSGDEKRSFDWSRVCAAVTYLSAHGHRVFGVTFSNNRHRVPACVKRRCERVTFVDRSHQHREIDDEECIRLAHTHDGFILDNDNYRNFCAGRSAHLQWFSKMREARSLGYFFHRKSFCATSQLPRLPCALDMSTVVILVSLLSDAGDPV